MTPPTIYYSGPNTDKLFRRNMAIMKSIDDGVSWEVHKNVDRGEVSYSALQILPSTVEGNEENPLLGLLYERSDTMSIVFEPDQIVFVKYAL